MKYIFYLKEINMIKSYLNDNLMFNGGFNKDSKKYCWKSEWYILDMVNKKIHK